MKIKQKLSKLLSEIKITDNINLPFMRYFRQPFSQNQTLIDYIEFLDYWLNRYFKKQTTCSFEEYLNFMFFKTNKIKG